MPHPKTNNSKVKSLELKGKTTTTNRQSLLKGLKLDESKKAVLECISKSGVC